MTNYITAINQAIASKVAEVPNVVLYGENLTTGSRISGLTRNLEFRQGGCIINVGNCEATHCGVGFGLMMSGVTSVLFVKQLDFMLLGMDHFVNTYNFVRCQFDPDKFGSFTIVAIVCNQGYQGPHSSFNALGDMCSVARVPGYTITNSRDLQFIVDTQLTAPGFRFVTLSQKMFPSELLDMGLVYSAEDGSVFQYEEGSDATIVCFNFSLPDGLALRERLSKLGLSSSLFSANYVPFANWEHIIRDVVRTNRIVVIDDSKSVHLPLYSLLNELAAYPSIKKTVVTRESNIDFGVCPDNLKIDYDAIVETVLQK